MNLKEHYYLCSPESPITKQVKKYIAFKKRFQKLYEEFSRDNGIESKEAVVQLGSLEITPTEKDLAKFKEQFKVSRSFNKVFTKTSPVGREWKKRIQELEDMEDKEPVDCEYFTGWEKVFHSHSFYNPLNKSLYFHITTDSDRLISPPFTKRITRQEFETTLSSMKQMKKIKAKQGASK